ncbi:NADH-quinone oxidoreductase subunit NuoN [Litorimonas sp. RW-G-Af-16]|uniref:NADH-quinone oxidoreductase subunit NuoN n=1 Tax=Litorimonas sp. RW-G-Af-16 TaxID=3241168 RepID=UPI00390C79A4
MLQTLSLMAPQLVLAILATTLLLAGVKKDTNRAPAIRWITIGILIVYALIGFLLGKPQGESFQGLLRVDDFTHYINAIMGLSAAAALMLNKDYFERERLDRFEFSVLTLYAVLGMSIMASANNLLSMYVGLEMQSLALYIMAAFNRDSLRASEAGLKYFVLGAISSGLLLYGASMVYGFTGSLEYPQIAASIAENGATSGVVAGMVFLLCGLAFKISAAPFHMWTPDVYEGAPTPVTGFFAAAPKLAAMAVITRLLVGPFGDIPGQWQQVIITLSVLSMFVGAIGALVQTNIKRLMAYSSIANMGYALVPLAAGTVAGVKGMLIFMTIYVVTVIGVFAAILQMRIRNGMVEQISDLGGLSKTNRPLAMIITILMFSLMGIPPLLGFFGKVFAFTPAFEAGLVPLAILALIASVISAFYYLRVIKTMWFDDVANEFVEAPKSLKALVLISALIIFPLFMLPFTSIPIQEVIGKAAAALF